MADQHELERLEEETNPYTRSEQGSGKQVRRDGDPLDQSDQATDEAVDERAKQSPSRLNEGDR